VLEHHVIESHVEHPDAEILRDLPGLGDVLVARVLAELAAAKPPPVLTSS
jgi:hypothetical protein